MAVAITRRDLSVDDLRREAARSRDANATRRMLAIALVLDRQSREDAAAACGMDRQSLRDWVHRYNAEGIAGLANRRAPGPVPRLSAEQEATVERWIEDGPSLERDGVVRWRCRDVQERIAREFTVSLHERTVGKPGKSDSFAPARQAALPALVGPPAAPRERPGRTGCF